MEKELYREKGLNRERIRKKIKNRGHIYKKRTWIEKRYTLRKNY